MRSVTTLAASSLLASAARAQVVQMDIQRRELAPKDKLRKRFSTYTEVVSNDESLGGYFATVSVGTPSQNLTLQLDTGSSDIWVPSSSASVCETTNSRSSSSSGCSLGSCKYYPPPAGPRPPAASRLQPTDKLSRSRLLLVEHLHGRRRERVQHIVR